MVQVTLPKATPTEKAATALPTAPVPAEQESVPAPKVEKKEKKSGKEKKADKGDKKPANEGNINLCRTISC